MHEFNLQHNSSEPRMARLWAFRGALSCGLMLLVGAQNAPAADFTVTSPGFFYSISGQSPNPTITLVRGQTYTFSINTAADHPFLIKSKGVQNNNVSSGTITFAVPNAVSNYSYICSIHGFGGTIKTVAAAPNNPPPPPVIHILSLNQSSNIVLTSTGTNGWGVFPEYVTNLTSTNWSALTVETNRFLNGTNETICGKPPAETLFIRVRSQPN